MLWCLWLEDCNYPCRENKHWVLVRLSERISKASIKSRTSIVDIEWIKADCVKKWVQFHEVEVFNYGKQYTEANEKIKIKIWKESDIERNGEINYQKPKS